MYGTWFRMYTLLFCIYAIQSVNICIISFLLKDHYIFCGVNKKK